MKLSTLFSSFCAVCLVASTGMAQHCQQSTSHHQVQPTYVHTIQDATQADIIDTAVGASQFKTLVAAVQAAGLVDTLKGEGPFTVLAPTDTAFAKLPKGTVESLLKEENRDKLVKILTYHVIAGNVKSTDVVKLSDANTVAGEKIKIAVDGNNVRFNDSKLLKADIECSNGVIHMIDTVLIPGQDMGSENKEAKSIVETAVAAGKFNTLVAAVKAADLVETLRGEGPFTVFAPTDEAFAKISAETLQSLLKPENKKKLQSILTYHVVAGDVRAKDVVGLTSAKTVNGQEVSIKVTDQKEVMIDGAKVVMTDIECSNGVIHVIDAVILPQ